MAEVVDAAGVEPFGDEAAAFGAFLELHDVIVQLGEKGFNGGELIGQSGGFGLADGAGAGRRADSGAIAFLYLLALAAVTASKTGTPRLSGPYSRSKLLISTPGLGFVHCLT